MPKIKYVDVKFQGKSLEIIKKANEIIEEYARQGYDLTLRQLYYQFVARDIIPNKDTEYKRLGEIISNARLAGLIDWERITDRTRNLRGNSHWTDPADIIDASARSFAIDKWQDQPYRVEVWIEKDALVGVFERVCRHLDINFFSCRGYTSQSEMWVAARRLLSYKRHYKQTPLVLHFGDHDPSGRDMTRDITDRLELFIGGQCRVDRLALNMDQIERYNPPPNPAKISDSRYDAYMAEFGAESWELDALEPQVLAGLVEAAVLRVRNEEKWDARIQEEQEGRALLKKTSSDWDDVVDHLTDGQGAASLLEEDGSGGKEDEEYDDE